MVGFGLVAVVVDQTVVLGNHLVVVVDQMIGFGLVAVVVDQMIGFEQVAVVVDQIADLGNHLAVAVGRMAGCERIVVCVGVTVVLGNLLAVAVGRTADLVARLVVIIFHNSNLECMAVGQTVVLGSFADHMNFQPFQA